MAEWQGITEVAEHLGVSPGTLRYFERRGIVPAPPRGPDGRRRYGEPEVHLLEVLLHLRRTGMPLAQIADFTHWVANDPDGVPERLGLLRRHRDELRQRLAAWRDSLAVIDAKIANYERRAADSDDLLSDVPAAR